MRLGIVPFMNLKPLIGFYEQTDQSDLQLISAPPNGLFGMLERGEVNASFVASVDYLRNRDRLFLESRFGVATRGAVASVLLLSHKPMEKIERILVDERSVTSTTMLRVLLYHRLQLSPQLVSGNIMEPEGAEAVLVIGDRALQGFPEYEHIYDIGQLWTEWTHLPFIFGVFVSKKFEHLKPMGDLLLEGWLWTQKHWEEIIQSEVARTGLSPEIVRDYLQERIQYVLTDREHQGLRHFMLMMRSLGSNLEITAGESHV